MFMPEKSKPDTPPVSASTPTQKSVAPAGTTAAPGCSTRRLARSRRYSQLQPSRPGRAALCLLVLCLLQFPQSQALQRNHGCARLQHAPLGQVQQAQPVAAQQACACGAVSAGPCLLQLPKSQSLQKNHGCARLSTRGLARSRRCSQMQPSRPVRMVQYPRHQHLTFSPSQRVQGCGLLQHAPLGQVQHAHAAAAPQACACGAQGNMARGMQAGAQGRCPVPCSQITRAWALTGF